MLLFKYKCRNCGAVARYGNTQKFNFWHVIFLIRSEDTTFEKYKKHNCNNKETGIAELVAIINE
jgi:hypothetical protein